jgi:uncharacterized protein
MNKNKRREFLKKSLLGVSGAVLIPGSVKMSITENVQQNKLPELPGRILGKTGIHTPLISMGAESATNPNLIKAAYLNGVKMFFSANYYGEGNNERLVGEGLKGLNRDSFVIGTAVTPDGFDTRDETFAVPFNIEAFIKKVEASLKRFNVEYIDILLFPYAGKREVMLNESLLKAFKELKEQGKTKFVGIATHANCVEAIRAAADSNFYDVVMTAYNFKIKDKEDRDAAIADAVKKGVGVMVMKTIAGAYHDKSRTSPVNSDAALKWVLQNKNISSIVSGMSSFEELDKNIAMIKNLEMTDQELKDINLSGINKNPGLYCHQCHKCISQCPGNLEIPMIMRSYMYAYGYGNMEHAQHTLKESGLLGNPCEKCDVCSVNCTAGFNIKERIMDISRLRDVPSEFLKT